MKGDSLILWLSSSFKHLVNCRHLLQLLVGNTDEELEVIDLLVFVPSKSVVNLQARKEGQIRRIEIRVLRSHVGIYVRVGCL